MQARWRPFCSRRCADVDLNRWLSGVYAVPVTAEEDEDGDGDGDPPLRGAEGARDAAREPARVIEFPRPRGRTRR